MKQGSSCISLQRFQPAGGTHPLPSGLPAYSPGRLRNGRCHWSPWGLEPHPSELWKLGVCIYKTAGQGSTDVFCAGPDIKYFGLRGPALFCCSCSALYTVTALDSKSANKEALFMDTETGNSYDFMCHKMLFSFWFFSDHSRM